MSETALAWAAGLFEGEGSISVHTATRSGHTYRRLCIALGSTDEDVIRAFQRAVGVGNVNGPYGPYPGSNRPCWRWQITGTKAEAVLDRLLPFLGARRTARAEEVRRACA